MKSTKRLVAPHSWNIKKKKTTYVVSTNPGPHSKKYSVPMLILLKDLLSLAETKKEAKKILNSRAVLVDNVVRTNIRFPVGLFDSVSMPSANKYYRMVLDRKGRVMPVEIKKDEANIKLCKITGKRIIKNNTMQIALNDGRTLLVKDKSTYNTKDTVLISTPEQKIIKHVKFEKDTVVFLVSGNHVGEIAVIQKFHPFKGAQQDRVRLKNKQGKEFETLEDFVFVIGEKTPLITIGEKE